MASPRERGPRGSFRCRFRATHACKHTLIQISRPDERYRHFPGVCSTLRVFISVVWVLSDGRVFIHESADDENDLYKRVHTISKGNAGAPIVSISMATVLVSVLSIGT